MAIDIQQRQHLESLFRSEQDRKTNAEKKKLQGAARILYLEKRVKLKNAEALATSGQGLGLMKLKVKEDDGSSKKKKK
jgi:hypothetical protein